MESSTVQTGSNDLIIKVQESIGFLNHFLAEPPRVDVGFLLDDGFGPLIHRFLNRVYLYYPEIPNFPPVIVDGQEGSINLAKEAEHAFALLHGRILSNSVLDELNCTYGVYLMRALGMKSFVSVTWSYPDESVSDGEVLLIRNDFIKEQGERHFDVSLPLHRSSSELLESASNVLRKNGFPFRVVDRAFIAGGGAHYGMDHPLAFFPSVESATAASLGIPTLEISLSRRAGPVQLYKDWNKDVKAGHHILMQGLSAIAEEFASL